MARHLKRRRLFLTLTALALLPAAVTAAQDPSDPMRPSYLRPAQSGMVASGPRLQAVMGNDRQRIAIVNGLLLAPGDRFGQLSVVHISAAEVELRGGQQRLVLRMPVRPEITVGADK
jgi:hypothetical protein